MKKLLWSSTFGMWTSLALLNPIFRLQWGWRGHKCDCLLLTFFVSFASAGSSRSTAEPQEASLAQPPPSLIRWVCLIQQPPPALLWGLEVFPFPLCKSGVVFLKWWITIKDSDFLKIRPQNLYLLTLKFWALRPPLVAEEPKLRGARFTDALARLHHPVPR